MARPMPFVHPFSVRYLEVDRQGVVFNMWYLAYLDDAMTAFLSEGGLPYADLLAAGYDVRLVHTELDWRGPLGFGEPASVLVGVSKIGRTSFTLRFDVVSAERVVAQRQHGLRRGSHRRVGEVRASSRASGRPGARRIGRPRSLTGWHRDRDRPRP